MNNECKIIHDILPLYVENISSHETNIFVEEHLAGCDSCRNLLSTMKEPPESPTMLGTKSLKNLKKKLLRKKIITIIYTSAIVLAIVITGFAFLTAPKYLPYTDNILSLEEAGNGMVICSFSDEVTGYNAESYLSEDGKTSVYHISVWNTVWDEYFAKYGKQSFIIKPVDGKQIVVYYSLNNTAEDILIYGTEPYTDSGIRSLPRLVLGYYLTMAVMACFALTILLFIFKKKLTAKLCIEKLLFFPISYIAGHICIKGFSTTTYSSQRDFSIILLVAILVNLACMLGLNLYRAKMEGRDV